MISFWIYFIHVIIFLKNKFEIGLALLDAWCGFKKGWVRHINWVWINLSCVSGWHSIINISHACSNVGSKFVPWTSVKQDIKIPNYENQYDTKEKQKNWEDLLYYWFKFFTLSKTKKGKKEETKNLIARKLLVKIPMKYKNILGDLQVNKKKHSWWSSIEQKKHPWWIFRGK